MRMRYLTAMILLSCNFCSSYVPVGVLTLPRLRHRAVLSSSPHLVKKCTRRRRDESEIIDSIIRFAVNLNDEKVRDDKSESDSENEDSIISSQHSVSISTAQSDDSQDGEYNLGLVPADELIEINGSHAPTDAKHYLKRGGTKTKVNGLKDGSTSEFRMQETALNGDDPGASDAENQRSTPFGRVWTPLKRLYTTTTQYILESTRGSSESLSIRRLWRRRHARTLEEGIRREIPEGSERPERAAELSSLLDRAQMDARTGQNRRYVERTLMGLMNALAEETEDLDIDIDSIPNTPIWRKEVKELRINFSRLGFKPIRMGGSDMTRFQAEVEPDDAETAAPQLPLVECADEAFSRLDADNSGTLDREEIAQALSMISGLETDKESIDDLAAELVDLYDVNSDGVVDREEYQHMVEDMAALQDKKQEEKSRQKFTLNAVKKSVQSISQEISKKAAQVAAAARRSSSSDEDFVDELEMGSIVLSNLNLDLRQLLFGNIPFIKRVSYICNLS
jgi:hypothetical protein